MNYINYVSPLYTIIIVPVVGLQQQTYRNVLFSATCVDSLSKPLDGNYLIGELFGAIPDSLDVPER
jgi:hypothetical protein